MTPFHFECRGTRYPATYDVLGRFIEVATPFGTHRAVIGLAEPQKLARAILRNAVLKHLARPMPAPPVGVSRASLASPGMGPGS